MIGKIQFNESELNRLFINKNTECAFPDVPLLNCPGCGFLLPDFDGFGVVAHVGEFKNYPPSCGYCSHPSQDQNSKGKWVCGICSAVKGTDGWDKARTGGQVVTNEE